MLKLSFCCSFIPNLHELWFFFKSAKVLRKHGSNEVWLGRVIHRWKDLFESYKIFSLHSKKDLIWKRYEQPKFWNNKSPNFEIPTWESQRKVTFGCKFPWKGIEYTIGGRKRCLLLKVLGRVKLVLEVVPTNSTTPLPFNLH